MKKVSASMKQTLARHDRQMEITEKSIRDKIKNNLAKMSEEAHQHRQSQVCLSRLRKKCSRSIVHCWKSLVHSSSSKSNAKK